MNRRISGQNTCGTKIAVAAMTLCGLGFLSGCPDFDLSSLAGLLGGLDDTATCIYRNDGECDDGRPGSMTSLCPFGTDPEDCDGTGGATNVTGTWRVTEIDSSNCDDSGGTSTGTWNVTQSGRSVTVLSIERNIVLTGTITGSTINLQGSFPEDGGTTTVTSTNITVGATGNTITGSETWFWTGFGESCSGTTSVSGSRN